MAVNTPARRSTRRTQSDRNQQHGSSEDQRIPQVYREMLAEAEAREPQLHDDDRTPKRRKMAGRTQMLSAQIELPKAPPSVDNEETTSRQVQTVYDSPSSSSEESDMEWEDISLQPAVSEALSDDSSIQITLDRPQDREKRKGALRRQPITAAEKRLRLDIHKVHLLCLLRHVQIRNRWCNDDELQGALKRMISKQVISLLHPPESKPEHSRSTTFIDGLNQLSDAFSKRFKVTKPGLKRPHWAQGPDALKNRVETILSNAEVFTSLEDFRQQAKTLQGSRDFGAQLFCALLRSAAVEARLVCSLQPLPFSGATKEMTSNVSTGKTFIMAADSSEKSSDDSTRVKSRSGVQRLTRPGFKPPRPSTTPREIPYSRSQESSYPVFWVEAFNEAINKWIPVDPLVTRSLAKPSKFEPPATDPNNLLSYVVAFEDDASARDVTRRYSKAFNAKTRKFRVESITRNAAWWDRALRVYEKPFLEDRDQLEVSELTAKTAAEPMPRNIQDFKDHPVYALERHLRRSEVIHPKRVIGQVSLGKPGSKTQVLEPVYRRSDVQTVRSADKWYRLGRDIKTGEQPLKRVKARKPLASGLPEDDDEERDAPPPETPLYAIFQTQVYVPPPVVDGRVPKNVYGNLDVYVPSMVPAGGIHIGHPDAAHAARLLGVDFAAAVTGFTFQGRHGTAVYTGVIVAEEYREALQEVIEGLEQERLHDELETRTAEVLRAWKHLLLKLRIAERVKGYAIEGDDVDEGADVEPSEEGDGPVDDDMGGGFIPELDGETPGDGGFIPEPDTETAEPSMAGGFLPESDTEIAGLSMGGGGFIPESDTETPDASMEGGGFLPESPSQGPMDLDDEPSTSRNASMSTAPAVPPPQTATSEFDPAAPRDTPPHPSPAGPPRYSLVVVPKAKEESIEPSLSDNITSEASTTPRTAQLDRPNNSAPSQEPLPSAAQDTSKALSPAENAPADAPDPLLYPVQSQASDPSSRRDSETSLLSQDPDDEDAIPEWLMSD
ncbi:putative DNA repair protein Rad4 [Aspergillus fijiensis CBS 313.89]|uniref:Rad4-domain-containing protein n=1 Tax=Aspergillus fijiensis CBS 313.89 TaxID=1448319 RepID=A0A8G1VXC8_9EURO|nr:Rad4-domain-containing protein [Aspergillus fijiensis CBS 313.89]RAK76485.1 Rad4-domain-containing protein [Aspergillus fijiensis CBS 313.89]